VDVAIVGGGLAGLTAARDLVAGGKTVAVLGRSRLRAMRERPMNGKL